MTTIKRTVSSIFLMATAGFGVTFLDVASAQTPRHGRPAESFAEIAQAIDPGASSWSVDANSEGAINRIRGTLQIPGADWSARARSFATRYGALFGIDGGATFQTIRVAGNFKNGDPRFVRLQQYILGFEVLGGQVTLSFHADGTGRGAHGRFVALGAPAPVFTEADAREFARAALAGAGIPPGTLQVGAGNVRRRARENDGVLQLFYQCNFVIVESFRPVSVDVDARTGAILAMYENKAGDGKYIFEGVETTFPTAGGKANVYTSLANALVPKAGSKPLAELGTIDIADSPGVDGGLYGRFAQIIDVLGADAFSSKRQFMFDDSDPAEADLFDQADMYYWITQHALALLKIFEEIPTDYAMPVLVNVPAIENAFYSPTDLGSGFGPGFMLFGDPSVQTGDLMDDYSRDPSVVGHEYFHAVADKFSLQLGDGAVDTPPRAVNEAIADYFSATFHNNPLVGPVISKFHLGPDLQLSPTAIRNLDELRTFPEDLTLQIGSTGLPEEHEAGLIFGASLWRLREVVKNKFADFFIAGSLGDWPNTMGEVGFATVNPGNAEAAYRAFYQRCLEAVVDFAFLQKGSTFGGRTLGALMENGALGNRAAGTAYVVNAAPGITLNFDCAFLGGVEHSIAFNLAAGQKIDITLNGNAADGTLLDFEWKAPENFAFPKAKTIVKNGQKVSQVQINTVVPGVHTLDIRKLGPTGRYKARIRIK